jgi:hypothetical protein
MCRMLFGVLLLCFLISCRAEKVGVFVPPVGVDSVSRHDLERDMIQLFKGKEDWVPKRMKQMNWLAIDKKKCFVSSHQYESWSKSQKDSLYFSSQPSVWSHPVHQATMLSVAKGLTDCPKAISLCICEAEECTSSTTSFVDTNIQKIEDVDVIQLEKKIKTFIISEVGCPPGEVP